MIPLPAERTQRSLLGLLSTGVVEFAGVRPSRKTAPAAGGERPREAAAPEPPPQPPPAPPPATAPAPPPEPPAAAPRPEPADEKAAERRREILEAWDGLKTRTHFEVLGLSRSVGEAEVKDAYFRLAKRFHPDVHHGASLGDLRDKLEAVFIRLGEAYDVLRDPRKRGDYEERLGRPRPKPAAEAAARRPGAGPGARRARAPARPGGGGPPRRGGHPPRRQARRAGEVLGRDPAAASRRSEAVQGKPRLRARVLLARCYAENPKWAKSAEATLLAATREEPKAVEPWALLGAIYAREGPAHPRDRDVPQGARAEARPRGGRPVPRARTPRRRSRRRTRDGGGAPGAALPEGMMRATLAALALLLGAPLLRADVVVLVNGDRVTGRVVGKITRRVRLQTPYGVLVIPADKVERIRRDDGSEELLNVRPAPTRRRHRRHRPPRPSWWWWAAHTFWQAWDPKAAPEDPSLRLEVRLDDRVVASYTDVNLDPEDLPKAVVNSFVFSPERLFVSAAEGVTVAPPELAAGQIRLPIVFPAELAGRRRLRLAYQVNDAGSAAPQWRDVVLALGEVVLAPGRAAGVRVVQERGTMDYVQRRMRNVETFRATLAPESTPTAP